MSELRHTSPLKDAMLLSWLLAATGGFVDTAGFLGLDGVFCAHVTGNLVLAGTRLAAFEAEDALVRLLVLPVYALATAITMVFIRRRKRYGHNVLSACLGMEAVALSLFAGACLYFIPVAGAPIGDTTQMLTSSLGVIAMAIQNTTMRECLPHLAPTTVMTGNLTGGVSDALRLLWGDATPEVRQRAKRMGVALAGFMLGSMTAAWAMRYLGFICLLAPIAMVTVTGVHALRLNRRARCVDAALPINYAGA